MKMDNNPSINPDLSIITPFYNEAESLNSYFASLLSILEEIKLSKQEIKLELICIDDGSTDNTFALLKERALQDSRIKFLGFSRNFGKEAALTAGLDFCSGDAVIFLDADLQDPPELIPEMLELWHSSRNTDSPIHVVLPIRSDRRQESWLKRVTAALFYRWMSFLSDSLIPPQASDFRLIDRQVVQAMKKLKEKNRFMKGLFSWPGFRTEKIFYTRQARKHGKTKQNYIKLFALAFDGIFGFSVKPLYLFSFLGAGVLLGALVLMIRTLINYFQGVSVEGFASLMLVILFLNGINLLGIGILGEYIGRIYTESKDRPIYIVQDSHNIDAKEKL